MLKDKTDQQFGRLTVLSLLPKVLETTTMTWRPMIRLGASTQELAYETLESLLGYPNLVSGGSLQDQNKRDTQGLPDDHGHKPARADLQKIKDVYDLKQRIMVKPSDPNISPAQEWEDKYAISADEQSALHAYGAIQNAMPEQTPDIWFYKTVEHFVNRGMNEAEAKKLIGGAFKKREESCYPKLWEGIQETLTQLYRNAPESYKLWPWAIKQIKDSFQQNVSKGGNPIQGIGHIEDIALEAGSLLSRLKAENRTPPGMDFNQMNLDQLEEWLMQWKRDNREAEAQGEVVYQFHDGWTIQRLTNDEQLQFEGDEMGHCVGGYTHQVEAGRSIIYSLRDPKGMPHTTFEIEGLYGLDTPDSRDYDQSFIDDKYYTPHNFDTQDPPSSHRGMPLEPTFKVVQVQGKSDSAPKPEYQRKVKEFLDSLREKGIRFERSPNWYGNADDYGDDDDHQIKLENDWHDRYPNNPGAKNLMEWYDEGYKTSPHTWQVGGEDAYGMNASRKCVSCQDWAELLTQTAMAFIDDYDRERYTMHDWSDAAQATYHAFWLEYGSSNEEIKQRGKKEFLARIQEVEDKLYEWDHEYLYHAWEGGGLDSEVANEYESQGGHWKDEMAHENESNADDPELWETVREEVEAKVQDYYSGNAHKYLNYLANLADAHDGHDPAALPNPNERHGGLPSYQDAITLAGAKYQAEQKTEAIPGALSSWHSIR